MCRALNHGVAGSILFFKPIVFLADFERVCACVVFNPSFENYYVKSVATGLVRMLRKGLMKKHKERSGCSDIPKSKPLKGGIKQQTNKQTNKQTTLNKTFQYNEINIRPSAVSDE